MQTLVLYRGRCGKGDEMANRVWRTGRTRAMVYVEGREAMERLVATIETGPRGPSLFDPVAKQPKRPVAVEKELPRGVTAVYTDRRGKPFAWQIAIDAGMLPVVEELFGATVSAAV